MGTDPKPGKTAVATRITTPELERLKAYCEDREMSRSDALRLFIKEGLDRAAVRDGARELGKTHHGRTAIDNVQTGLLALILLLLVGAIWGGL